MTSNEQSEQNAVDEETSISVNDILMTNDQLCDQFESYRQQLERELPAAQASGDHRYLIRIELSIKQIAEIEDALDDVLQQVGALRHLEGQLKWARDGKMV